MEPMLRIFFGTWVFHEPHFGAVVVFPVPDLVQALVAHILLDQRDAGVVESGPAVDQAVLDAAVALVDHRKVKLKGQDGRG